MNPKFFFSDTSTSAVTEFFCSEIKAIGPQDNVTTQTQESSKISKVCTQLALTRQKRCDWTATLMRKALKSRGTWRRHMLGSCTRAASGCTRSLLHLANGDDACKSPCDQRRHTSGAACDDDIIAQWFEACYEIGNGCFVTAQARAPPPISSAVIGPTIFSNISSKSGGAYPRAVASLLVHEW